MNKLQFFSQYKRALKIDIYHEMFICEIFAMWKWHGKKEAELSVEGRTGTWTDNRQRLSVEVAAHLKCDIIDFANKIISTHSGHATDVTDQKIKGERDQRE